MPILCKQIVSKPRNLVDKSKWQKNTEINGFKKKSWFNTNILY